MVGMREVTGTDMEEKVGGQLRLGCKIKKSIWNLKKETENEEKQDYLLFWSSDSIKKELE